MTEPRVLSAGFIVVHGERPHDQSGSCRYLLLRAYHYWDFPKGEVAAREDPLKAARREVGEETGLAELHLDWGEKCYETEPYGRGKVARYYLGRSARTEVQLPVSPELGRPEHHEYRWLPYAEARPLLVPRVAAALDWAHEVTGC